ncbi:hypothetical protein MW887_010445 [Aspergillus wentii]|nr:hypothetical protein MW887_010445 [Aspergillus wentii]
MTSDPARSGLHPFSHLKAGPTTSSSRSTAQPASSSLQPHSPTTSNRPRLAKSSSRDDQIDAASEKATVNLIRRVLCPQTGNYGGSTPQPLEELLPPLTSSNDVDRQLYALIAIIIREFVYSWYSKITSDQVLVNEVLQVIAHCTRALEQRLRQIDVAQVILDEIPALVETHIACLSPVPDPSDTETIAQQCENEALYRQLLVHGTLAVLLPTEDLENVCMQTIVGDVLADLIIGNGVDGKVSEGWFLWESITKILDGVEQRISRDEGGQTAQESRQNQLKKFGLLSTEEDFQNDHSTKAQSQISIWFWSILQYAYLTYVALRFIATGLLQTASTPPTNPLTSAYPTCHTTEALSSPGSVTGKRPVLNYRICSMLSQLMDLPQRMPWLGGFLALVQYLILAGPGRLGDTDSVLDR